MPSRAVPLVDLIVHELRTPLTVAIGSLQQLSGLADPVQHAAVARALRSCERLEHLARELRDWTRLEVSPAEPGVVELSRVLTEAVDSAAATRAGDVDLVMTDLPEVMIRALPHQVAGALASLLVAVVRAAEAGDVVTIHGAVADGSATVVVRRPGAASCDTQGTFDAERLGGLGFSLPLARAVIVGGGGQVTSVQSSDGRLQAITVHLAVARPEPSH